MACIKVMQVFSLLSKSYVDCKQIHDGIKHINILNSFIMIMLDDLYCKVGAAFVMQFRESDLDLQALIHPLLTKYMKIRGW